jgi:hypothetical protein
MTERDPNLKWELRRSRVYGSRHIGYFRTQKEARAAAEADIEAAGWGYIESTINNVVYYTTAPGIQ